MALRAVLASFVVHAGLAVGLAAGGGGHAPPGEDANVAAAAIDGVIEIEPAAEVVEPPVAPKETTARAAPPRGHTHPFPVPADHDARPHDAAQPHDHASGHAHGEAAAPAAAAASPALTSEASSLPVFALASGGGTMTPGSTRVAGDAAASPPVAAIVHPASAVSVPAKLVAAAPAAYPSGARADDVEGEVGLEIVVDADGRVIDARVVKHAGHGFDESALAAIRGYRFSPAERHGQRVRVRMPWTVQFRLR